MTSEVFAFLPPLFVQIFGFYRLKSMPAEILIPTFFSQKFVVPGGGNTLNEGIVECVNRPEDEQIVSTTTAPTLNHSSSLTHNFSVFAFVWSSLLVVMML